MRKVYSKYGDKVEIVVVEDLARGDFTNALDGVSAVIHAATPIPGREELKDVLEVSGPSAGYIDSSLPQMGFRSPGREHSTLSAKLSQPVSNISPMSEQSAPFWISPSPSLRRP